MPRPLLSCHSTERTTPPHRPEPPMRVRRAPSPHHRMRDRSHCGRCRRTLPRSLATRLCRCISSTHLVGSGRQAEVCCHPNGTRCALTLACLPRHRHCSRVGIESPPQRIASAILTQQYSLGLQETTGLRSCVKPARRATSPCLVSSKRRFVRTCHGVNSRVISCISGVRLVRAMSLFRSRARFALCVQFALDDE